MNRIIETAVGVFVAIGGVTGLIIICSGFISKLWAEWFMKKKTMEYDKQLEKYKSDLKKSTDLLMQEKELQHSKIIESYKNQLNQALEISKSLNERFSHKNKKMFDFEVEIYKEIMITVDSSQRSIANIPILSQAGITKYVEDVLSEAQNNADQLLETLGKYSILINKNNYEMLKAYADEYAETVNDIVNALFRPELDIGLDYLDDDLRDNKLFELYRKVKEVIDVLRDYLYDLADMGEASVK